MQSRWDKAFHSPTGRIIMVEVLRGFNLVRLGPGERPHLHTASEVDLRSILGPNIAVMVRQHMQGRTPSASWGELEAHFPQVGGEALEELKDTFSIPPTLRKSYVRAKQTVPLSCRTGQRCYVGERHSFLGFVSLSRTCTAPYTCWRVDEIKK